MKLVVQKHLMGCGLACVACVTNTSYDAVLELSDQDHASSKGYMCRDLIKILAQLGQDYEYKKVNAKTRKHFDTIGSIVFIARSEEYPAGHYLVRTEKGWMNPWKNYPCISPAKAGWNEKLPGEAKWVLFPSEKTTL